MYVTMYYCHACDTVRLIRIFTLYSVIWFIIIRLHVTSAPPLSLQEASQDIAIPLLIPHYWFNVLHLTHRYILM